MTRALLRIARPLSVVVALSVLFLLVRAAQRGAADGAAATNRSLGENEVTASEVTAIGLPPAAGVASPATPEVRSQVPGVRAGAPAEESDPAFLFTSKSVLLDPSVDPSDWMVEPRGPTGSGAEGAADGGPAVFLSSSKFLGPDSIVRVLEGDDLAPPAPEGATPELASPGAESAEPDSKQSGPKASSAKEPEQGPTGGGTRRR